MRQKLQRGELLVMTESCELYLEIRFFVSKELFQPHNASFLTGVSNPTVTGHQTCIHQ